MSIFKYNTQLKQLKELKAIQEEKENIQKQLDQCQIFKYSGKARNHINTEYLRNDLDLAPYIALLWTGGIDFNIFNAQLQSSYNIDNSSEYFEELGNYFLNLSKNIECRKPLKDKLEKLNKKEQKLKDKLGIK